MKITLDWLNEYVDLSDQTAESVGQLLTAVGLEVEGITGGSPLKGDVVVGKILTAAKHPNADTLQVCTVDAGDAEPLGIVCGAPNARAGLYVVVAKNGSVLPGDFKIKKSKIRGVESNGMLCSEQELGLSDESAGIIELPGEPKIGSAAAKLLGLENAVLELKITPNRGDCLGALGLARDLAAKLKRPLKAPRFDVQRDPALKGGVEVVIDDPDLCARFVALPVRGVAAVPSPKWMQKRLEACGMRPINLLVDVSNYVMLETGQPIHCYDARDVRKSTLRVRAATAGESLKTLDGQTRALVAGDILICDGDGPIGLAGVMGGESSEVKADTKDLVVEVASFAPRQIRRTAKRLALSTEASHRFERGTDVDALPFVAARVAYLIADGLKAAGQPAPRVAAEPVDAYPADVSKRVVALRLSAARQFLALPQLQRDELVTTLTALGFEYLDGNDDRLVFEVPYARADVEREVDLFEEVARIGGFDRIPYQLPVMSLRPTPEEPLIAFTEVARTTVASLGFRETISFPFFAAEELTTLGIREEHPLYPSVLLANPLSGPHGLMQTTLVPGLLKALLTNRRQGESGARLFEVGRGYFDFGKRPLDPERFAAWRPLSRPSRHISPRARQDEGRITERQWVAGALDQPFLPKTWDQPGVAAAFFHGKAAVMGLLRALGVETIATFVRPSATDLPHLNPGASAFVHLAGRLAGYVGELHPRAAAAAGFGADAVPVVFELDLEALLDGRAKAERPDASLTRFPPVTRDLAFQVKKEKTHGDFEKAIAGFKQKKHLRKHQLFDVYEGASLPAGTKSMAYRFAFQSPERTLTDAEVDQEVGALLGWLNQQLEATQR